MKTAKRNFGVNAMAALALFGAALTLVMLFVALAEAQRKGFAEGNCDDANVALWEDFEETSGNLTVPTGCAAAATVLTATGNPVYSADGPAGAGKAITFDGTGDYFTTSADVNALDFGTSNAVVEGWVKNSASSSASDTFVGKYDGTNGWILYQSSTAYEFFVRGDGANACEASAAGTRASYDGAWVFIRATWVNSTGACTIAVYSSTAVTNGSETDAAAAGDTVSNASAMEIGARQSGSNTFIGSIADLRVTVGNATNDLSLKTKVPVPSHYVNGKLPARQQPGNCSRSTVMWLAFDEASGNIVVPTGCLAASTTIAASGGPTYTVDTTDLKGLNTAITFDGTNDRFSVGADTAALNPGTNPMVIDLFVKSDGTNANGEAIITKRGAVGTPTWRLTDNNGPPRFAIGDASTTCTVTASQSMAAAGWHYVRATWNGSNVCTVKIDDNATASTTQAVGSVSSANTTFRVGGDVNANLPTEPGANTEHWGGTIADARVCIGSTALTDCPSRFNGPAYSGFTGSTLTAPTFTRATVSTRVNPVTGLVEAVASGVPVVGAPLSSGDDGSIDGTEPTGVYVGAATTFAALHNENVTSGSGVWSISGCITTGTNTTDVTAPDGTNTAEKQTGSGCVDSSTIVEQIVSSLTANQSNTLTMWLRGASGGEQLRLKNTENGVADYFSSITLTNTWQRYVFTQAFSGGATSARIGLTVPTSGGPHAPVFYIWRPQLYQKTFAVPLDPAVTTSSVTINQDHVTHSGTGIVTNDFTMMLWANHPPGNNAGTVNLLSIGEDSVSNKKDFNLRIIAAGVNVHSSFGQNNTFGVDGAANTWHHYAVIGQSGNVRAFLNGTQLGSACTSCVNTGTAGDGTGWLTQTEGDIAIGRRLFDDSGDGGFHSDVRVFQGVLTPQQIRALYLSRSSLYADASLTPRQRRERQIMLAAARPLDFLWGQFSKRSIERERVAAARRAVASPDFPQPTFVVPQELP